MTAITPAWASSPLCTTTRRKEGRNFSGVVLEASEGARIADTLGADGALGAMRAGTVLVDHTTASAQIAREIHAAATARGIDFLDAPVSGGQAGAENGKLTIMVGGEAAVMFEPLSA